MPIPEIVENRAVAPAGAVLAQRENRTIIVLDPDLSTIEKTRLIKELLTE